MEDTGRKILENLLARRVGQAVYDVLSEEKTFDEDVHIDVVVDTPSCYLDDVGKIHSGRLITVVVEFMREEDEDC